MKLFWTHKLPTGAALEAEAERLGVSLRDTYATKDGLKYLDEPELQRRVLAAWNDQRDRLLNLSQTVLIIITALGVVGTLVYYVWSQQAEAALRSADLMLAFDQKLYSGRGADVMLALDLKGNLDHTDVSAAALNEFLHNYELLAAAYRHGLIDNDMAYDAFSYELEKALKDTKIRRFLVQSRQEEPNFYDGVLRLARSFGIDTSQLRAVPAVKSSPTPREPLP